MTVILTVVKWYLSVVLICIFLMISDVEYLYIYRWLFVCLLWKMSIQFLCPVVNHFCLFSFFFFFFLLNGVNSLYIFWVLTPIRYLICKCFLPFCRLFSPLILDSILTWDIKWFNLLEKPAALVGDTGLRSK